MKIDINKKYRYRNGKPARIVCVDAEGDRPVVSLNGKNSYAHKHYENGRYYETGEECQFDLIEISEPREIWVNELANGCSVAFIDKNSAILRKDKDQPGPFLFREVIED